MSVAENPRRLSEVIAVLGEMLVAQSLLGNGEVNMASGRERVARKWVSVVKRREGCGMRGLITLVQCAVLLLIVPDRTSAISYRKDTGFATDGMDQFVFREPATSVSDPSSTNQFTPMYSTHIDPSSQVKRSGRVRFADTSDTPPFNGGVKSNFFGTGSVVSGSSPVGSPFAHRDRDSDQFYTVGASIQFAGSGGDTITPPPPLPPADNQQKPKRRKNKYKYVANDKIYNAGEQGPDQGQFSPYAAYGSDQQRYSSPLQGNYLTPNGARPVQGGQFDSNYPELQKQQYPFSIGTQYPGSNYYNTQQQPVAGAGGGPYNPYQYQYPGTYASDAAYPNPYQQGYYPAQQPQSPVGSTGFGQPPNAQSILGVLQSIFNFAPGTFGTFPPSPTRPGSAYASPPGPAAGFGGVGGQLRQALDNISENDELQCVPKLICMMSRSSSGQGFSSYVNRGLLSTILSAVPDSSPWLKFSRAALLGYGIGANSCDAYYPKCPKDEMQILYYLNNHRGGFFRFFNNGEQGQYPQQQQYG
ncbi:uncharacterized protein LOC126560850 [Anopheles maculipalpis]|uniref:uncharacterized protein LOC126560850 n=1 Tax=Anopheles maculipalpis TaxID=1496333 RepID=UPI00215996B9|nr:uncharacterized protein LOC126560850 [Anopheles maculipalpis]